MSSSSGSPTGTTEPPSTSDTGEPTGPVEFIDDEADEFMQGTFFGVEHSGGQLHLASGEIEGEFRSRVFDAGADARWQRLSWNPAAPYAKPLPDGGAAESGYQIGNVDMLDNVVLFHFDEPGMLGPGTAIADDSGRVNDGFIESAGPSSSAIEGMFGYAMDDHLDAYVSIPAGAADLDFGNEGVTWAIWFRITHGCSTNNVYIGVDDVVGGGDPYPHLWLGCTVGDWPECPPGSKSPDTAGVFRSEHSNPDDGGLFCAGGPINDGEWHHAAIVKQGAGILQLYVDGELRDTVDAAFSSPLDLTQDGDFAFGGFSGSTYPTSGRFDDAAIWRRALDETEIGALYRRGVLRVGVQVRICEQEDCADDPPFVGGPNLEQSVAFTDPDDALSPGAELSVVGLATGRYAQYRLVLDGLADDVSPALDAVRLVGEYL
jgi:hypothetical protein